MPSTLRPGLMDMLTHDFQRDPPEGAYEIDLELHADERGLFARSYCWREFEAHGLNLASSSATCPTTGSAERCEACTTRRRRMRKPN